MNSFGPLAALACLIVLAFGLVYLAADRIAKRAARRLYGPRPSVRESDDLPG